MEDKNNKEALLIVSLLGASAVVAQNVGTGVDGVLSGIGFGLRLGAFDPSVAALLADTLDETLAETGHLTTRDLDAPGLAEAIRADLASNGVSI